VIPIKKINVDKALDEIDRKGVPPRRRSTGYCIIARKHHYPPKYVLSRAHFYQSGKALKGFKGGPQTNDELRPHYPIVKCKRQPTCY
jgi:hypothetical protein